MDFRQLSRDLRQNAMVVVAVFLLCVVVGWAAAFVPADRYVATTSVVASPLPGTSDPSGAVAVIDYVLPLLPPEATNVATLDAVRASVRSSYDRANVTIDASVSTGTGVVTISATASDPGVAAAYANGVARQLSKEQGNNGLYELRQLFHAVPPTAPSNSRGPILAGAAGLGVIVAVFAGLGSAGVRRRLNRAIEIRQHVGAKVVAELPHMSDLAPAARFAAVSAELEVEAFHQLRSNLFLSRAAGPPVSIAITSCGPAEGKTFVAANLAWVISSLGKLVAAVDCDIRQPRLHSCLDAPFGAGISGGPEEALKRMWLAPNHPWLGVIPAGVSQRHPADVIASNLPRVIQELKAKGGTVVVDCPPLIGSAETALIASMVDMVVVVVDARRFRAERLEDCLARLESAGATIAGVVLNRVRVTRRSLDAYGYGYGYGSSRATTDTPPSPGGRFPRLRPRWARRTFLGHEPVAANGSPLQPVDKNGATAKPVVRSSATAKPAEKSGSTAKPVEKSGATAKPVEKSASTAKPAEKIRAPARPVEKSGAPTEPAEDSDLPVQSPATSERGYWARRDT